MDSTSTPVAMHGSWQLAATRRVALVVASASGPGLFESLVAEVASALPAAAVMVSVFADDSQATLRVLAMHENGQPQPGFDYPVVGSPCAQVVGRDYRYYANGVRAQVDPRSLFAQAGFDAYAAFPLNDGQGRPLGVLAALDRVPIAHGDAEHAEVVLKVVAGRLAAELERQQALQDLRQTAVAVSSARAESVFADLAAALAQILRVDCAYIAHQRADDPGHLATLALQRDGVALPGLRYALAASPCSEVLGRQFHVVERDLARRFPDDPDLLVKGPESYAGHPLVAQDGAPLGVIAVGSRQPLVHAERIEAVLRIFAVRAAAEVERLAATEALRRSEASYRGIFEAAPDSIYVHDWETFAFRDFNRTAAETLGYTRADLLAVEPHQLMAGEPPYDVAHAFEFLRQAKLGRCPPFEWRTRRKDGSLQWQEVHLKPVVIDGAPQILAFTRDISERKAAEQRLRASEEQYRAIFDASDDALILWNSRYERVDVNPAYERLFGWTRDEVVGRSFEVFSTDPVYAQPRRELVTRALAGETCRAELQYQRKDGRRIDTEIHTIPFRHRGEPHVLAIARDITERTRLEEQLRQAQKMEAIGQLTGGIAHDFNNILTSVLGYIVLARERALPLADERLLHQLAQAQRAGERARDLVAQMLAFARRKSGRRQALAPQALLLETVELLRATLPSSVLLEVCAAGAALPVVEVDPVQMGQVLMNLLINARDAVAGAGRVQVGLHAAGGGWRCAACAAAVPDGSWVEVRVADDGCGIEPDTLRRIFDPFFTTKPSGHGSGMGLAMVHGIVHDHGGHVVVDTRVGAGATFRVLLPAAATQTTVGTDAPPRPAPSTATALAGHVLVVEDDEQVGAYLAELLGAWGLEVTLHADAREALRWLEDDANRAQLVITDLTMPHLSGLQLARKALLHRPGLPVLLVSADLSAADARALADSGVRAALPKPVDAAALRRAVLSALAA